MRLEMGDEMLNFHYLQRVKVQAFIHYTSMDTEVRYKKLTKEEQLAVGLITKIRRAIYGIQRPHWFVQINYHLCSLLAGIALIWHLVTWFILENPTFLKQHKSVDVVAIVERRGSDLGFSKGVFYATLSQFSLISTGLWALLIASLIFLWRGKNIYVYFVIGIIVIYMGILFGLLGGTYFIEDTTVFDKISLLLILSLTILQNFIFPFTQAPAPIEVDEEDHLEE